MKENNGFMSLKEEKEYLSLSLEILMNSFSTCHKIMKIVKDKNGAKFWVEKEIPQTGEKVKAEIKFSVE